LETAKRWLREAEAVAVLTGAGISAESGVPTFRSSGGLWRNFRAEELATPAAFRRDPAMVWEWYDWRRGTIARCQPNPGHHALAALEARRPDFTLVTQNVDGLHDRAGSRRILKIHGDIWQVRCEACGRETRDERTPLPELPPRCEACGAMMRPGVVWFGEPLPAGVWDEAERACLRCRVLIVAGTSASVYPAAGLAPLARRAGAKVIEINVEDTPLTAGADCALRGPSGEILPGLIQE
jgi:NAD-dependent deacetylase